MEKGKNYLVWAIVIFLVVAGIIFIYFQKESRSSPVSSPVEIEMNLMQTPKLNDIVDVELKIYYTDLGIKSSLPQNNFVEVGLILPGGFEYVGGELEFKGKKFEYRDSDDDLDYIGDEFIYKGYLSKNESKVLNAKIKAVNRGENWEIISGVALFEGDNIMGDSKVLFVTFNENSGKIFKEISEGGCPLYNLVRESDGSYLCRLRIKTLK